MEERTKRLAHRVWASGIHGVTGKPADILPEMPGKLVVMGLSTTQNAAMAAAIRKKLEGK